MANIGPGRSMPWWYKRTPWEDRMLWPVFTDRTRVIQNAIHSTHIFQGQVALVGTSSCDSTKIRKSALQVRLPMFLCWLTASAFSSRFTCQDLSPRPFVRGSHGSPRQFSAAQVNRSTYPCHDLMAANWHVLLLRLPAFNLWVPVTCETKQSFLEESWHHNVGPGLRNRLVGATTPISRWFMILITSYNYYNQWGL